MSIPTPPPTLPFPISAPPHILSLLSRLHALSTTQENSLDRDIFRLDRNISRTQNFDDIMRDKFIALDEDKCHFVYQLCLAINAKNIVEAGTSFGVSTMYLALAVGRNVEATGGKGVVIATENETSKAEKAREYWKEAGEMVTKYVELREGDLRETLKGDLPEVDLLLLDIWSPMALPTLKVVQPRMRRGAVVIVDNTIGSATGYKDLLAYLRGQDSGFTNLTLPYNKGLEMSVYVPMK